MLVMHESVPTNRPATAPRRGRSDVGTPVRMASKPEALPASYLSPGAQDAIAEPPLPEAGSAETNREKTLRSVWVFWSVCTASIFIMQDHD